MSLLVVRATTHRYTLLQPSRALPQAGCCILDLQQPVTVVAPHSIKQSHAPVSQSSNRSSRTRIHMTYSTRASPPTTSFSYLLHCRLALEKDFTAHTLGFCRLPLNYHSFASSTLCPTYHVPLSPFEQCLGPVSSQRTITRQRRLITCRRWRRFIF